MAMTVEARLAQLAREKRIAQFKKVYDEIFWRLGITRRERNLLLTAVLVHAANEDIEPQEVDQLYRLTLRN